MNKIVGAYDILFVTLDTLRYDVAQAAFEAGRLGNLARLLPTTGWEKRHAPGNFTWASHQAFFAGFLPTPISPGPHPRLFAADFPGSETTAETTFCFEQADLVSALAAVGYRTVCIGGVGFFNKLTALGAQIPSMFQQSYWSEELGVTCADSTQNQVELASRCVDECPLETPLFLFINISALHQPNCMYLPGAEEDSAESQLEALVYVDGQLGPLFDLLQSRRALFGVICSDHGTAYGEDGYHGHRLNHTTVGEVPYLEFVLPSVTR